MLVYQEENEAFQGACVPLGTGEMALKWLEVTMVTLPGIFFLKVCGYLEHSKKEISPKQGKTFLCS